MSPWKSPIASERMVIKFQFTFSLRSLVSIGVSGEIKIDSCCRHDPLNGHDLWGEKKVVSRSALFDFVFLLHPKEIHPLYLLSLKYRRHSLPDKISFPSFCIPQPSRFVSQSWQSGSWGNRKENLDSAYSVDFSVFFLLRRGVEKRDCEARKRQNEQSGSGTFFLIKFFVPFQWGEKFGEEKSFLKF